MALNTSEPVRMPESKIIFISASTYQHHFIAKVVHETLTASDSLDDLREDLQAANGAVDLPPGVVRDDDALAPDLERL